MAEDRERDLEIQLHWPSSHVGTLLPARQTELSGHQLRAPRKPGSKPARKPARDARSLRTGREWQPQRLTAASPPVVELAHRVQELTNVVAGLGARMEAQVAELKHAGGAFTDLRQSTDELRLLRDSIESLVSSRNQRQASLEAQLELLTDEIRALRRQVPAGKRAAREQTLAETIGDAVRSAIGSNGNGGSTRSPKSRHR